jgi:hypothetical protein
VKSTKAVNVLVQQAFDNIVLAGGGVPSLVSTEVIAVVPEDPLNGGTPALTFYASITYPFFRIVLINTAEQVGNVYLTTKLITAITPDDDGVLAYGSENGTDPIVLKTNSAGNIILKNVNPAFDEYTAQISGDENVVISQTEGGVMKIESVAGVLAKNNTFDNIYTSTVTNTANSSEDLIYFADNAGTSYQIINAGSIIPTSSVDTQNIYTVSMMGQFLNNSEVSPSGGGVPQFSITRTDGGSDVFSIQSSSSAENRFAGQTIYPLNGLYSPGSFIASNPGDSGMTIGPEGVVSITRFLLLAFNISNTLPTLAQFQDLISSSINFSVAGAFNRSSNVVNVEINSFVANRVTLRITCSTDINFPSATQFNVISLYFQFTTSSRIFCPATTLINSSAASSGGYSAINTVPVNLTNAGNPLTQMRGSTKYIFNPSFTAFVTLPPVYELTDQLAFEFSNDNINWNGGATAPDFSLLVQTLPPIPEVVPYSRYIYNFSIQTLYIFARYVRIKAVKKMLLRQNYQILGQKVLPNPLRLI